MSRTTRPELRAAGPELRAAAGPATASPAHVSERGPGDEGRARDAPAGSIADSPRAVSQRARHDAFHHGPRMVAQRQRSRSVFGDTAQRQEGLEDEQPSQDGVAQLRDAGAAGPPPNRTGLPDGLKSGLESLSGLSMDHVRVHYNSSQPVQLNALAYAQGRDIHLAPGQERHLPHEAWHVVQQAQGRVPATRQLKTGVAVNDDDALEHEADVMGEKAAGPLEAGPVAAVPAAARPAVAPVQARVVQRRGEFKARYKTHPDLARTAVSTDLGRYASFQKDFEIKLGAGLYSNAEALAGADTMLRKMEAAMKAAGIGDKDIEKAFALSRGEELGGVLEKDVREALSSGNIREKMGMVYQARFKIAEALDILRQQDAPAVPLGEEIQSDEMATEIDDVKANKNAVSHAVLKRRPSIANQERDSNPNRKQKSITGEYLEDLGVPLSDREKRAAKERVEKGKADRRFVPGSEFYVVPPKKREQEQALLRRVVAGLSGSTDMYFHIAKHLAMTVPERRQLRLAALAQMIVNSDHSYHEIMHVARTQGELTDYPDELPIGYTTLAPLTEDQILAVAKVDDFPGDVQVRNAPAALETTRQDITGDGGDPAKRSHRYATILRRVDEYHQNPKIESLGEIIRLVDDWMEAKKPGRLAFDSTRQAWQTSKRRIALEELKTEAQGLLTLESAYLQLDVEAAKAYLAELLANAPQGDEEVVRRRVENFIDSYLRRAAEQARLGSSLDGGDAKRARDELARKQTEMDKVRTMLHGSGGGDWQSKDFRADKSLMDKDLSKVDLPDPKKYGVTEGVELRANATSDLKGYVIENRGIIDTLGGDVSKVPDLRDNKPQNEFQKRMADLKEKKQKEETLADSRYQKDTEDFTDNLDTSILENLAPGTPVDKVLRQMEGKPVPAELEAINLYSQVGFYEMMNKILNKSGNKQFMATVPQEAKDLVSLAVSGLRKMKPYAGGAVFRGEHGSLGSSYVRNTLTFKPKVEREAELSTRFMRNESYSQFVSTAKRPYEAYSTKDDKWLAMEIRNVKTGVDISAIANTLYEREVLFPPGATFKAVAVIDRFVTKEKGTGSWTDLPNRYDEAPINANQEGRVKVIYDEA